MNPWHADTLDEQIAVRTAAHIVWRAQRARIARQVGLGVRPLLYAALVFAGEVALLLAALKGVRL